MRRLYRPRWPLLLALIGGVAVLVALTYLPKHKSGGSVPERGGEYTEGVAGAPSRINPLFAPFNDVDRDLTSLVFSGLVRLGPKGEVLPDLADMPKVTPDGLKYIFSLQPGLVWQDGQPLDANDVVFTIQAIQDPSFQGDAALADLFRGATVEASEDGSVTITLPEAFAPFLAHFAGVGILPKHLLGKLDAAGLFESSFNQHPVGSGPFRLTELTATHATLVPFPAYHLGRPHLDRLQLDFYRDDAELLNALVNNDVEGALFRPGLQPEELRLLDDSRWERRTLHPAAYSLVYLNPVTLQLRDPLVRGALQRGLDRNKLITEVLGGQALPVDSPIARDLWSSVPSPDAYAFDKSRAEGLLEAAGWERNGDGVRVKEGIPLKFPLATSDDPTQLAVATEIARQWGELGAQVTVQPSATSQFVEQVLLPRAYETALVTIDPGPDPDPYPFWHSTQTAGRGRNLAGFSDPGVDRVLENGRQTASPAERAQNYRAFQDRFASAIPAVLLHTQTYQYVVSADLQGLSPGLLFTPSARFFGVQRWFIEKGSHGG